MAGRPRSTISDRFWSKVLKTETCWLWQRQINNNGYGCFSCSLWNPRSHNVFAHRVAWILTHGPIPEDLCVLHRCDVRACVNPDHLFLGTYLDNARDMKAKGRMAINTPNAKLSPDQVRSIRRDTRHANIIAADHGIVPRTVYQIKHGDRWAHIA